VRALRSGRCFLCQLNIPKQPAWLSDHTSNVSFVLFGRVILLTLQRKEAVRRAPAALSPTAAVVQIAVHVQMGQEQIHPLPLAACSAFQATSQMLLAWDAPCAQLASIQAIQAAPSARLVSRARIPTVMPQFDAFPAVWGSSQTLRDRLVVHLVDLVYSATLPARCLA